MAEPSTPAAPSSQHRSRERLSRLRWLVRHPLTQLAVGLLLVATSLFEASQTLVDDFHAARLRASHGLLLLGLIEILRTLPDLVEGLERYFESTEKKTNAAD